MDRILAWACGLRSMMAWARPGRIRSAVKRPAPVSSRVSSLRGRDCPNALLPMSRPRYDPPPRRTPKCIDIEGASMPRNDLPVAVVLAGGLARRMGGGDKPLLMLAGRPLLDHALDRVRPQSHAMVLNANGDPTRFAPWGLPVVADTLPDFPGPLAGILAAMRWTTALHPATEYLLSVPGDTPFLPQDLGARLAAARLEAGTPIACAASEGRVHPVI